MQVADLFASLSLKTHEGSFDKGNELVEKLKKGLEYFAAYEVAKGFVEIFKGVSETAIAADRMAQKIGVSMEAVQELGYAAKTTGVSQEELQIGFTKMAKGLEEFRTKGTGPVGEALVALKVPMEAIKKDSPDEVLSQIADRFADMPDGIKKTALAMEVFGKSGANLIPFLNKGGDGIAELKKEAEELGIVVDKGTAKSFEELEESTLKIEGSITGFKNTLAIALLPTIKKIADSLFNWIKANKDVIASGIKTFAEGMITVFRGLASVISVVVDFVRDNQEVFEAIGSAIGFVIDHVKILGAIVVAPFALMFAAVYGVWKVLGDVWKSFATGKGIAASAVNWIGNKIAELGHFVVGIGHGIVNAFDSVWEFVKSSAKAAFEWIINLPVVKQLIELYNYFKNSKGTDDADAAADKAKAGGADAIGQYGAFYRNLTGVDSPAGSVTPAAGGGGDTHIDVGGVNVSVSVPPGTSTDEATKIVTDSMNNFWNQQMRGAKAGTGGSDQ